jgi:hypothetical protein
MSLDVSLRVTAGTVKEIECYRANITHNLGKMAQACDLYLAMWRPEEIGCVFARDIIDLLRQGIEKLISDPDEYKKLNPKNGWGDYEGLLKFAREYLQACRDYPEAKIYIDR